MSEKRLFVGLFVPVEAARAIHGAVRGLLLGAGFRFVPPEEIHVTLRFLGGIEESRVQGIRVGLERTLEGLAAPRLRIRHTGSFPKTGAARVLWAGVEEDPGTEGRLAALADAAETAAVEAGLPPSYETAFHAHATVARPSRRGASLPPEDFRRLRLDIRWLPSEVLLVESRPGEVGQARFPTIASFPLLLDYV
jgi:RNA 2',3'-cyclic 3'-phosphodiesterase